MNLHQIVGGAIAAVNPTQIVTIETSTGYTKGADFTQIPTYAAPVKVAAQVQDLSGKDLRQLDALNVQGSMKTLYCNGIVEGIVRVTQKGGDLITLADGSKWLTTQVLEGWPDWCKIAITLQNGA